LFVHDYADLGCKGNENQNEDNEKNYELNEFYE